MGDDKGKADAMNGSLRQYRVKEVAKLLTLSEREVYRLVAKGDLPRPIKIGRCSVWFDSDIGEFQLRLQTQQREGKSL